MKSKKKLLTSAVALGLAGAMALGGTFAWQSINQTAINEASNIVNPGGRLHNDLSYVDATTTNSRVYVENFAENDIYARVRLGEYMEIVGNYDTDAEWVEVVTGKKLDKTTGEALADQNVATEQNTYDYEYTVHKFGTDANNATDKYFTLTSGEKEESTDDLYKFQPTFNKNKDSLMADLKGLYADRVGGISNRGQSQYSTFEIKDEETKWAIYDKDSNEIDELKTLDITDLEDIITNGTTSEKWQTAYADSVKLVKETHNAKAVGNTNGLISMTEWKALNGGTYSAETHGNYWVYDTDGWVYWSSPIKAGAATGLLLDHFTLNDVMDDTWYYALEVTGQFITADDLGKKGTTGEDGTVTGATGFYADGESFTDDAKELLKNIGVDVDGTGTGGNGGAGDDAAADTLSLSVTAPKTYYEAGTQEDITLSLTATKGEQSVDSTSLENVSWTLSGNSSSTALSDMTNSGAKLSVAADEENELTVSVSAEYEGRTATKTLNITNGIVVNSMVVFDSDNKPASKYTPGETQTYTVKFFNEDLEDLDDYDPANAYSGEALTQILNNVTYSKSIGAQRAGMEAPQTVDDNSTLTVTATDGTDKITVTAPAGSTEIVTVGCTYTKSEDKTSGGVMLMADVAEVAPEAAKITFAVTDNDDKQDIVVTRYMNTNEFLGITDADVEIYTAAYNGVDGTRFDIKTTCGEGVSQESLKLYPSVSDSDNNFKLSGMTVEDGREFWTIYDTDNNELGEFDRTNNQLVVLAGKTINGLVILAEDENYDNGVENEEDEDAKHIVGGIVFYVTRGEDIRYKFMPKSDGSYELVYYTCDASLIGEDDYVYGRLVYTYENAIVGSNWTDNLNGRYPTKSFDTKPYLDGMYLVTSRIWANLYGYYTDPSDGENVGWRANTTSVRFANLVTPKDLSYYFYNLNGQGGVTFDWTNLDTSKVVQMEYTFARSGRIYALDLSSWDTSKVRCASNMFENAHNLKTLELGDWETDELRHVQSMFRGAKKLKLDCSDWDVSKVDRFKYFNEGTVDVKAPTFTLTDKTGTSLNRLEECWGNDPYIHH